MNNNKMMKNNYFLLMIATVFLFASNAIIAQTINSDKLDDFTQNMPSLKSKVNWTTGLVQAEAAVLYKSTSMGTEYEVKLATDQAEKDALQNLVTAINYLKVFDTISINTFTYRHDTANIAKGVVNGDITTFRASEVLVEGNRVTVRMGANIFGKGSIYEYLKKRSTIANAYFEKVISNSKGIGYSQKSLLDSLKHLHLLPDSIAVLPQIAVVIPAKSCTKYCKAMITKLSFVSDDGFAYNTSIVNDSAVNHVFIHSLYTKLLATLPNVYFDNDGFILRGTIDKNVIVVKLEQQEMKKNKRKPVISNSSLASAKEPLLIRVL